MDLGEAVQTAIERGLPLLLSTEAAGHLKDTVRVGRMKGRPGMLTITSADGLSATTRRVVGRAGDRRTARAQAPAREGDARRRRPPGSCAWSAPGRSTTTRCCSAARSEMAALKVVGSGVDASQVGTGKTITTRPRARAPRHHHAPVPRARGRRGPPARPVARRAHARRARRAACRRWRPTPTVRVLGEHRSIAGAGTRASTASSATAPASCSSPTACSTATRPTCRRSPGTC